MHIVRCKIRDQFGPRSIETCMRSGHPGPGIFNISGFAAHCRGERAQFLYRKCLASSRNFVAFTYSGLESPSFDPVTQRHVVNNFDIARWTLDAETIFCRATDGPQLVIANSFGSDAGLKIATKYPEKVIGLLLIAPMTDFYEHLIVRWLERFPKADRIFQSLGYIDYKIPPTSSESAERFVRVTKEQIEASRHFEMEGRKEEIIVNCPVIIIHDPNDRQIAFGSSVDLIERIVSPVKPRLIPHANAGHTHNKPVDFECMWEHASHFLPAAHP